MQPKQEDNNDGGIDVSRRESFRAFYGTIITDSSADNVGATITTMVLESLHDKWSEIRKDSSKLLHKASVHLSEECVISLLDEFLNTDSDSNWQITHGNILGMKALVNVISKTRPSYCCDIRRHCVGALSHQNQPVREASRSCLRALMSECADSEEDWSHFYSSILARVEECVRDDVEQGSERYALELDGLLGSIEDAFLEHAECFWSLSLVLNAGDADNTTNISSVGVLADTLRRCVGHPASTVRQRAASLAMAACRFPDACSPCVRDGALQLTVVVVDRVAGALYSMHSESAPSTPGRLIENDWFVLEGHLLVAEGMLNRLVDMYMAALSSSALPTTAEQLPLPAMFSDTLLPPIPVENAVPSDDLLRLFLRLIEPLCLNLLGLMTHHAFEVRRLCSQLLPSLARATVLHHSCPTPFSLVPRPLLSLVTLPQVIGGTEVGSGSADIPSVLVYLAWTVELLKCVHLIVEAINIRNPALLKTEMVRYLIPGDGDALDLYADFRQQYIHWASHVHRRLTEADRQRCFYTALLNTVSTGEKGATVLQNITTAWFRHTHELIPLVRGWAIHIITRHRFLSSDLIETVALLNVLRCALACNSDGMSTENDTSFSFLWLHCLVLAQAQDMDSIKSEHKQILIALLGQSYASTGALCSLIDANFDDKDIILLGSVSDPTSDNSYWRRGSVSAACSPPRERRFCHTHSGHISSHGLMRVVRESHLILMPQLVNSLLAEVPSGKNGSVGVLLASLLCAIWLEQVPCAHNLWRALMQCVHLCLVVLAEDHLSDALILTTRTDDVQLTFADALLLVLELVFTSSKDSLSAVVQAEALCKESACFSCGIVSDICLYIGRIVPRESSMFDRWRVIADYVCMYLRPVCHLDIQTVSSTVIDLNSSEGADDEFSDWDTSDDDCSFGEYGSNTSTTIKGVEHIKASVKEIELLLSHLCQD